MSREARLLLMLGVFGVIAVIALGSMARRYQTVLEKRDDRETFQASRVDASRSRARDRSMASQIEQARSARLEVDSFIRVRRMLRENLSVEAPADQQPELSVERLSEAMYAALADSGLERAAYQKVRQLYRSWKSGAGRVGEPFRSALDGRRADLEGVSLGRYERFDL